MMQPPYYFYVSAEGPNRPFFASSFPPPEIKKKKKITLRACLKFPSGHLHPLLVTRSRLPIPQRPGGSCRCGTCQAGSTLTRGAEQHKDV